MSHVGAGTLAAIAAVAVAGCANEPFATRSHFVAREHAMARAESLPEIAFQIERFDAPRTIGLVRASWGRNPLDGVPVHYAWEIRNCETDRFEPLPLASEIDEAKTTGAIVRPVRRTFFVNQRACGLRLRVFRTNAGAPHVSHVEIAASAANVFRTAQAESDETTEDFRAHDAIDGRYATRWAGRRGERRWTLRVAMAEPAPIDRIHVTFGFNAVYTKKKAHGYAYGVSYMPLEYEIQTTEDGERWSTVAREIRTSTSAIVPVRRRLITIAAPLRTSAVRIVVHLATNENGVGGEGGAPVIREIAAYRADDPRPVIASPWVLSVNANPTAQSETLPGGALANDMYYAGFIRARLAAIFPWPDDTALRTSRGTSHEGTVEPRPNEPREDGATLESIEADDPSLSAPLLTESYPPPLVVLSGSNLWEFSPISGRDPRGGPGSVWNPILPSSEGGLGDLESLVKARSAPLFGVCGGAQILALLEGKRVGALSKEETQELFDRVLSRTTGIPIRRFATPDEVAWSWPGEKTAPTRIAFEPDDPIFIDFGFDASGTWRRRSTQAIPVSHGDTVRPLAFDAERGGLLRAFDIVASSTFCPRKKKDDLNSAPCARIVEAFRARTGKYPLVGVQFHPEQRSFTSAFEGDPPASIADPTLVLSGAFESYVSAYLANAR